jgi:hypothetical protein
VIWLNRWFFLRYWLFCAWYPFPSIHFDPTLGRKDQVTLIHSKKERQDAMVDMVPIAAAVFVSV